MKSEKGQALILVLILLAVGASLIVPTLQLNFSSLKSQRISDEVLTRQAAADATVEQALWQMLNDILLSGAPQVGDFTFDIHRFSISVPGIPSSENQGRGNVRNLFFVADPQWLAPGDNATKSYIIAVDTQKWSSLDSFGFTLPQGLTYRSNSTYYRAPAGVAQGTLDLTESGVYWNWENQVDLISHQVKLKTTPEYMTGSAYVEVYDEQYPPGHPITGISYLLIDNTQDGQRLEWRPSFIIGARSIFVQTLHVDGNLGWGVHYITGWFYGGENITTEETAAMGAAFYTVLVTVEGVTYQVVLAYDTTTGKFQIISYQIME